MDAKNLIPISDSKLMSYLTYRSIRAVDRKRSGQKVSLYYENNEEVNEAILDFGTDKKYQEFVSARHSTEELLRTTV